VVERRNEWARVAHEIGGALAPARSAVDLLRAGHAGQMTPETEHWLQVAVRGLMRAERILDNVVAVAAPESYRIQLESVSLPALLSGIAAEFEAHARARGVTLAVEAPAEVSLPTDRFALEQVLVNLVSNAIKFSDADGTVVLAAEPPYHGVLPGHLALLGGGLGPAPHCVRLSVRDRGPGLAEETRQRLYEPFFRGAEARARRLPGLGLGLAVARRSIALLHGDLRLDPAWRPGCSFVVTLPADAETLQRAMRMDACFDLLTVPRREGSTTVAVLRGPEVFDSRALARLTKTLRQALGEDEIDVVTLADNATVLCTSAPVRATWRALGAALASAVGPELATQVRASVQRVRRGTSPDECVLQGLVRCRFVLPEIGTEVRAS